MANQIQAHNSDDPPPPKKDKTCLKGTNSQNITVNLSKDYSNVKLGSIIDVEVKDISRLTLKA